MKFSISSILLSFFILCTTASAQTPVFTLTASGPHHVVQGHYLFFNVTGTLTSGTDEHVTPSVSGLPNGATATWPNMIRFCCTTLLYQIADTDPVKISTSAATPVGVYPLTITFTATSGSMGSVLYTLYVDPVPVAPTPSPFPADVPLTSLAKWQSDMITHGRQHCVASEMGTWEGFVWYYDGTRVYYQIADYTGDPATWNPCAQMVKNMYRDYVLSNSALIPGYRIFPHGLAMDYQRTGDLQSKQAVAELAENSPWSAIADVSYIVDWGRSREAAYGLNANLANESLGAPHSPNRDDLVELIFGHFDQWFVSKSSLGPPQPFMVGLSSEALIGYWNVSRDPRVPAMLKLAADSMWANQWDSVNQDFPYTNDDGSQSVGVNYQGLNLLIAPLYGWLYQQTGLQRYREEGDQMFNSGVMGTGTDLDIGKQFSQNYRWSPKYVEWRSSGTSSSSSPSSSAPSISITSPTSAGSYSTASSTIAIAGSASSGAAINQVTWMTDQGANGAASGTTSWTASGIALKSGTNRITVTARDSADKQASATITITYTPPVTTTPVTTPPVTTPPVTTPAPTTPTTTGPPTIGITSPTSASTYTTSSSTVDIAGVASASGAITQVTWATDHGTGGTAGGTTVWSAYGIALQSGANRITVTAYDLAGNHTSATIVVTNTPPAGSAPTLSITSPTSAGVYSTSNNMIGIAGSASDSGMIASVTWATNRGSSGTANGTTAWSASGIALQSGGNRITVTAFDLAGNQASATIVVTYTPVTIDANTLPRAKVGIPYSYKLNATGGVTPLSWTGAQFPSGIGLNADGTITGTPQVTGTYTVDVAVHDNSSQVLASAALSLGIDPWVTFASAATLAPGPAASESIERATGWQLSVSTASATTIPLPTTLAGSTVTVHDAQGVDRLAPLYSVSPNQITFEVPAGTTPGPATVTVAGAGSTISGTLQIATVAPSLFTVNQDGLAAGDVQRINDAGQTVELLSQTDPTSGRIVAIPIDLGPATDQVYLSLYGTGMRQRTSLDAVKVTVGGVDVPVSYAGSQGTLIGLDQLNVLLPQELRGRGDVDVLVTVDGLTSNVVHIRVQ